MLAPNSAGSSESARKMASQGSFQSLGSAKSEPAEWLPNRWGESYRLGDLGADQAPEGPAAKPRTFAEFRPEESRPGWLGVGAVGGGQPAAAAASGEPYDRGHPNGGAPKPFAPPRQTGEGYDGGDAPNFDAMREDLHGALSRLSTLEGRQRAQGKIAKLDGQWGGDCTQMTHGLRAPAHRRDQVLPPRPGDGHGDLRARGQLIALAHSIDKPDQRTLAIESDAVVTIDGVTQPPQRGPGGACARFPPPLASRPPRRSA
ncbi:cupin-like domain-containing protein [Aureococcus anophagefferens]|nr:cupin-like domain-containing protein [Aureococcus anophagefferens]